MKPSIKLKRRYAALKTDCSEAVFDLRDPAFFNPTTALIPCPSIPKSPKSNRAANTLLAVIFASRREILNP
jgi:hypothetical protein